jgi:hypothetical protein
MRHNQQAQHSLYTVYSCSMHCFHSIPNASDTTCSPTTPTATCTHPSLWPPKKNRLESQRSEQWEDQWHDVSPTTAATTTATTWTPGGNHCGAVS